MPCHYSLHVPRKSSAFSLVEVVLALGIVSFALLALMGMLPVGLRQHSASTEEVRAFELISAVAADIRENASGQTNSRLFGININGPDKSGSAADVLSGPFFLDENFCNTSAPSARYAVAVAYVRPATNNIPAYMRVVVAWPGNSATFSGNGPGSLNVTGAMGFVEALVTKTWP